MHSRGVGPATLLAWHHYTLSELCFTACVCCEQASGAALALVDAVVEASTKRTAGGEVPAGYSIARPPGHHATATQPMGFCLLNNVAIAARYAQQHHGLQKVHAHVWLPAIAACSPQQSKVLQKQELAWESHSLCPTLYPPVASVCTVWAALCCDTVEQSKLLRR